jgi:hypothetical protein
MLGIYRSSTGCNRARYGIRAMQPKGRLMCEKASGGCIRRWRLLLPTILISGVTLLAHVVAHGAVILQPDLGIERVGVLANSQQPSQLAFGPDGRLYAAIANRNNPNATSVVSFAYNPKGTLTDQQVAASTGGALGIAFAPVSLGNFGDPGVATTTGMYLTDGLRNGVSNLRVLTPNANGIYGGLGGTNTVVAQNIAGSIFHQAEQMVAQRKSDGSVALYVGTGLRSLDGVAPPPTGPTNSRETAWNGTISWIKDTRQVNGKVTDSAGFGMTGNAASNSAPDFSNAGPYTSTEANKLVVHSSGARNPFGLALDASGNLWFTNNFSRSQSNGTFDGTIDPVTHTVKGYTTGDPGAGPDLKNNVHDQLFKAMEKGDYGYNNLNWRDDASHSNTEVVSRAGVDAGFFDRKNLVRSTTFDNLSAPPGGFAEYDQSDINHIKGLGPSSSANGLEFYTGASFPASYRGEAFITRWTSIIRDTTGHSILYADLVAVDPTTGNVRRIADSFVQPIDVLEDGFGNLLIADFGDGSIWRIFSTSVPEPSTLLLFVLGGIGLVMRRRSRPGATNRP